MTFEELYENEEFRNEVEKVMRETDGELVDVLVSEAKKRGVDTDLNEIRSYFVSKMPVSDDEMDKLAAGDMNPQCTTAQGCFTVDKCYDILGGPCIALDSCYAALLHTDGGDKSTCTTNHACWSNYQCVAVYHHSVCAVIYNCAISEHRGE